MTTKPAMTVGALLRTALQLLENDGTASPASWDDAVDPSDSAPFELPLAPPARKEWLEAQQENRCIQVTGNAMSPILADGAYVAYSKERKTPVSSTARWSSSGWRTSRRSAGSGTAADTPSCEPRTPRPSPSSSSSTSNAPRSSPASGASSGSTRPTDRPVLRPATTLATRRSSETDGRSADPPIGRLHLGLGSIRIEPDRSPAQALVQARQHQHLPVADPTRPRLAHDGLDDSRRLLLLDEHRELHLGKNEVLYSLPRYWPSRFFCRPYPIASRTVPPRISTDSSAESTAWARNGFTRAMIFTGRPPDRARFGGCLAPDLRSLPRAMNLHASVEPVQTGDPSFGTLGLNLPGSA